MSLTLPTNYGNHAKTSNLVENWIIQLGYNEAFDQALDPDDDSINLVNDGSFDAGDTSVTVDEGSAFTAGDYIKVDNEVIKVTNISSEVLTIVRGQKGTTDADHANDSKIYFDNYTGIALSDTTVSEVFYHGVVTNEPRIRTSVDVFKSKASSSQISISLVNFDYQGSAFSEEILYGTRNYLNRTVKIYSQLNNDATLTNCLQIFHGRLVDVSHDNDRITLSVVEQRPWDFIEIPNQRTVNANNSLGVPTYFPVAYGDFSANISHEDTPALCHALLSGQDTNLYPIPVHTYDTEEFICLVAESDTSNSSNSAHSATPHWYEPNIDAFIPLLGSDGDTYMDNTTSYQGGNAVKAPLDMYRAFKFKPTALASDNTFTEGDSGYDAFDTASGASATALNTSTLSNHPTEEAAEGGNLLNGQVYSESAHGYWNMPSIDGKITYCKLHISGRAQISALGSNITKTLYVKANDFKGDADGLTICQVLSGGTTSDGTIIYKDFGDANTVGETSAVVGTYTSGDLYHSTNFSPANLHIIAHYEWDVGSSNNKATAQGLCYVSDIHYDVRSKLVFDSTNMTANLEKLNKVKMMYSGANGLNKSYNGGSGTATKGHHVHRDMLYRYSGWDAHDDDIYNWDENINIESVKSAWTIAWWQLEPRPLKEILEQLQYEMGFWFKWRSDGTGSYWFVKNSYSSGDVSQTFTKEDISKLSVRNTSWKDLVTYYDVEYKRHPARESRYLKSLESSDTTNNFRTTYNIQTKENKKSVKLDMNVGAIGAANAGGGNPNDGFTNYYLNLSGKVRKIISFQIVNPAVGYNLETGDIIQFSSTGEEMPVKPFGHEWNESGSQYYMIIELQRSRGLINIKSLEVG